MTHPKLEIRGLQKSFGAVHATQGVDLAVRPGELHALIGPNGAGKTTLLSQISGEILPDAGSIWLDGADITRMPACPGGFNLWRNARRMARLREPARDALERVGLAGRAGVRVSALAHGEKRQLEIAMALSLDASVLLLDEPMAGMGAEESQRMTALLQALKGRYAILLVEHDMDAVFALADRVTVLVYGKTIFTGTPDEVRRHPDVRAAYLGEED